MGLRARHLVLVKRSKTTPEVKEDFSVCTCKEALLVAKREGAPPHNKCRYAPIGFCGGIHLSKNASWEGSMDQTGVKK